MIEEIFWDDRSEKKVEENVYSYVQKAVCCAVSEYPPEGEGGYQVSVSFVDSEEIKKLNAEYRGKDSVTDVLSFPMDETDPRGVSLLGDVVICVERAREQAAELGHSEEREIAYLSVHSVLHLMGFDHETEEDKQEMRTAEKEIMKKLGVFKGDKPAVSNETLPLDEKIKQELIDKASEMRKAAYCPYSDYHVGAAILTSAGKVYTGCNIENASYPATICAERTAAAKAVSEGEREFAAVAIAVSGKTFGYPCGVCRQFLCEFIERDIPFFLINGSDNVKEDNFYNIFPFGFKRKDMQ